MFVDWEDSFYEIFVLDNMCMCIAALYVICVRSQIKQLQSWRYIAFVTSINMTEESWYIVCFLSTISYNIGSFDYYSLKFNLHNITVLCVNWKEYRKHQHRYSIVCHLVWYISNTTLVRQAFDTSCAPQPCHNEKIFFF